LSPYSAKSLEARFSEVVASAAGFCYLVCKHFGGERGAKE
jgi:hypothetical protein